MKTKNLSITQTTLWVSIATLAGLLIYALSFEWIGIEGFWSYRGGAVMATGVVAFTLMTLCMVTSIRSKAIEKHFHGLDKMYHLHKWTAIFSFTWVVLHWCAERGIKLIAQSQLVTFPPKIRGSAPDPDTLPAWWNMIEQFETPAKIFGEYGFYVLIIFVLLALLSMIPYSFFQKLHRFIATLYLLFAFHSIFLMPQAWWSTPTAYLMIALSIVGTYGAVTSLFRTYQKRNRYEATVEAMHTTDTGVIDLTLKLDNDKHFDYKAGQFVFIDFSPIEGAHPFSIGAATPSTLRFAIKPSGDFTKKMVDLIHTGQTVSVEGPYGDFDFTNPQPNQIWVAGGIGIAPFISQLQALAQKPKHSQKIDFWYSTMTEEENNFPTQLEELCNKANVTLHRVISNKDGYLNADK
ncbi:MAG: ferredoxin reductase family protein, partial [Saezia sp.]